MNTTTANVATTSTNKQQTAKEVIAANVQLLIEQLEQFSYRCSGIGRCQCGFSLKKSHVERIPALYSNRKTALEAGHSDALTAYLSAMGKFRKYRR